MADKNTTPKVAIITRTRDRGVLLERAIRSVHSQTMTDYVHVIINDAGDSDVVDQLVLEYKELIRGRVNVIHNTVSSGMEAASNKAIRSVRSKYIAIHDDDDTWSPDFLKTTTEHLESTGDAGVVVTTDRVDEEILGDSTVKKIGQSRWLPEVRSISLYKQCLDNYATPITFLYRRSIYDEIGGYDESLPVGGDWDFALRFLMKYDIYFLATDDALAYYHHRVNAVGIDQNSVHVNKGLLHEQKLTMVMNRHLRQELNDGRLGVGYLINSLHAQNTTSINVKQRIEEVSDANTVRIESHINHVSESQLQAIQRFHYVSRLLRKVKRTFNNKR